MKQGIEHYDKLGCLLVVGDCVAYPVSNNLVVGTVAKINNKMIGVREVGVNRRRGNHNKYPNDIIKLEGPAVTMYLIKNSTK